VSHNFQQLRFWLWQKKQTREKKRRAANNAVAVTAKSVRARVSANLLSNLDLGSFWHTMQREREREREREKEGEREKKRDREINNLFYRKRCCCETPLISFKLISLSLLLNRPKPTGIN
jgi:hypothetical protein